jgi:hypothetical protein
MWWADTANDLLKQRNAADSAWVDILTLSTGAVSNAEVADNAITLAKMAHGTDGEIITYDASGAPATVGVGTSGQVLTSNGAGSAPSMQGLPSSGADTSLSNLTSAGEQMVCRAWVNFNGTGTVSIRDDYNVSSITDNGTGDYTVNFSTAMANTNYAPAGNSIYSGIGVGAWEIESTATGSFTFITKWGQSGSQGRYDGVINTAQVFGD